MVFVVFVNAGFLDFEVRDEPLGACLGPSWPHLIPERLPKVTSKLSKRAQKLFQKMTAPKNKNPPILGPEMDPQNFQNH